MALIITAAQRRVFTVPICAGYTSAPATTARISPGQSWLRRPRHAGWILSASDRFDDNRDAVLPAEGSSEASRTEAGTVLTSRIRWFAGLYHRSI